MRETLYPFCAKRVKRNLSFFEIPASLALFTFIKISCRRSSISAHAFSGEAVDKEATNSVTLFIFLPSHSIHSGKLIFLLTFPNSFSFVSYTFKIDYLFKLSFLIIYSKLSYIILIDLIEMSS